MIRVLARPCSRCVRSSTVAGGKERKWVTSLKSSHWAAFSSIAYFSRRAQWWAWRANWWCVLIFQFKLNVLNTSSLVSSDTKAGQLIYKCLQIRHSTLAFMMHAHLLSTSCLQWNWRLRTLNDTKRGLPAKKLQLIRSDFSDRHAVRLTSCLPGMWTVMVGVQITREEEEKD